MEKQLQFRPLNADEIDCRVAQAGKGARGAWCSILLYKDARCDQRLLDETVGCFNWKRSHELINGNLFCTVSIRNEETGEWVSKQDVGVESYTEKEKGQASDAFKRACFNWGCGRELYTAPQIFINLQEGEYWEDKGKIKPTIHLDVRTIAYDDKRNICELILIDKNGQVRYSFGSKIKAEKPAPSKQDDELSDLFASSKAYIESAKTVEELQRVWNNYPQLQGYRPFITSIGDRKKQIA